MLEPQKALHVFLTSVAGVGEPPGKYTVIFYSILHCFTFGQRLTRLCWLVVLYLSSTDNGREFYEYIMNKTSTDDNNSLSGLEYAVFGLGSTAGHAAYFNVIGKSLDRRLEELGASRIMEIGLGDDGDCIEDDFDNWLDGFMKLLKENDAVEGEQVNVEEVIDDAASAMDFVQQREQIQLHEVRHHSDEVSSEHKTIDKFTIQCPGASSKDGTRMKSNKFPTLTLLPKSKDINSVAAHKHLFHLNKTPNQFYTDGTVSLGVIGNKLLGVDAGESAIHELKLAAPNVTYTTGDHLVVYPQNSQCIVKAYLDMLDVDGNAIIDEGQPDSYPFPKVSQGV